MVKSEDLWLSAHGHLPGTLRYIHKEKQQHGILESSPEALLATAVPEPMATPISAFFKAGASLTPSPVCMGQESRDNHMIIMWWLWQCLLIDSIWCMVDLAKLEGSDRAQSSKSLSPQEMLLLLVLTQVVWVPHNLCSLQQQWQKNGKQRDFPTLRLIY